MKTVSILLAVFAAGALLAQNPVVVSGQVTDAATGLPIEDATVSIGDQLRYTDSAGHYTLDPIAPGSATVRIEAKGYLAFEKTNPDDATIQIAANRAIQNFRLLPAASIVGRISAQESDWPRSRFIVTLLREDFSDGVRRFLEPRTPNGLMSRASTSSIDADGKFAFKGLEPGRYIVSAGEAGLPAGNFIFTARDRDGKPLPPKHVDEAYVQTFFPGTADFGAAIPISAASGETVTADFTLVRRRLYRVSGEAAGAAAESDTVQVESLGEGTDSRVYTGVVSDGKFIVEDLPPGNYRVRMMSIPDKREQTTNGFPVSMRLVPLDVPFSITDHDVTSLHLIPKPPLAGRISTTGQFRVAGGGSLPGGLSVQFAYPNPGGETTPVPASADGIFWLTDVAGEYSVRPVVPPAYAVTEIRYAGGNYLFSLIPIDGNIAEASITVVLSDQPATISGVLTDGAGKPVPAKVALLPDPIPAHFDFRAIRVAATNDRGGFLFSGIAPGSYKAIALTGDDRKQDHDMTLLGPRLGLADAFEVIAGQNLTISLRP